MPHRCGTPIPPYEPFRTPGATEVSFPIFTDLSACSAFDVPEKTFDALVESLRTKTATEIVSILASPRAMGAYGEFPGVVREIAETFEERDPAKAFELYLENWNRCRDRGSLARLPGVALSAGKISDAVKFFQIAKCCECETDLSERLHLVELPEGTGLVEAALAQVLRANPFDAPWIPEFGTQTLLKKAKSLFPQGVPDDTEGLVAYLRNLEFRALSLLDSASFALYLRTLCEIAEEFPKSASAEIFSAYALSIPSEVAEAGFRSMRARPANPEESENSGILGQIDSSESTVSALLFRRMSYALHYFSTVPNLHLIRQARTFFDLIEHADASEKMGTLVESIESMENFLSELPSSVIRFRKNLLDEVSRTYDPTFYDRLAARRHPRLDSVRQYRIRDISASVLIIGDDIACGTPFHEVSETVSHLYKYPVPPEASAYLGFVFAEAGNEKEAVRWLLKAGMLDIETVSLLLRIAAEYPNLAQEAVDHFFDRSPDSEKMTRFSVLSAFLAFSQKAPLPVSCEMCGDAERAFGDIEKALRYYLQSSKEGNDVALKKSANLFYSLGRFESARALYEKLYESGKDLSVVDRLCLCSLYSGNREEAAKYFQDLDPMNPDHANAYAAFHYVPGDAESILAGFLFIAPLPNSVFREFPKSLRDGYAEFAKGLAQELPELKNWKPWNGLGKNFWDAFGAFRALRVTFSEETGDAAEYFEYLRSALSVGLNGWPVGTRVLEALVETLRSVHGISFSGSYSKPEDEPVRKTLIWSLLKKEIETIVPGRYERSLGAGKEYAALLLEIAAIFEILWDSEVPELYRVQAAEAMDGDFFAPSGTVSPLLH